MARMPGATWRPVPNCTKGGQDSIRGVVLHVMAGTLDGSDSWFRNPSAQASAHFGVGKDGRIFQWVDTRDRAWAQADGNRSWLSIEHEGQGGDSLTAKQLAATASIVAWMHKTHGVKLQTTDSASGSGVGWHGMGGAAWGGHTACPGTPIKNQRAAIIKVAGGNPAPPNPGGDSSGVARYQVTINDLKYGYGASGAQVTKVGQALVKQGCSAYKTGPGPDWTDADTLSYQKWQKKLGYTGDAADGVPGAESLKKLLGSLPSKPAPSRPAYEPFPGAAFFHTGRTSPVITAMGRRLVAEGCSHYSQGPGPNFTNADKASYAAWQRKCGYTGTAADGIPGKESWDKLHVLSAL
ncbi:peptidoglycan-binding protein [Streptomyces sp. NPDC088348]|uniref:peptidoglycan-binding protein n=1 Tax=Streptomyces sp. NPDC088348 TaxID=3365853 RepID=UPI0037F878EE